MKRAFFYQAVLLVLATCLVLEPAFAKKKKPSHKKAAVKVMAKKRGPASVAKKEKPAQAGDSGAIKQKESRLKAMGVSPKRIKLVLQRERSQEAAMAKLEKTPKRLNKQNLLAKQAKAHAQWLKSTLGASGYREYTGRDYQAEEFHGAVAGSGSSNDGIDESLFVPTSPQVMIPEGTKSVSFVSSPGISSSSSEPEARTPALTPVHEDAPVYDTKFGEEVNDADEGHEF